MSIEVVKMKILNLYAGVGGNRRLWGDEHEITAVEIDPKIAEIYHHFFPRDVIIVADAHEYLLEHFKEYDFIWSSPPCPTHSRARWWRWGKDKTVYPDMTLWQEIILLQYHAKHRPLWVIENVIPYYKPLIKPTVRLGRHYFWANFNIPQYQIDERYAWTKDNISYRAESFGMDLDEYHIPYKEKRRIIRNMVHPEIGKYILSIAERLVEGVNHEH